MKEAKSIIAVLRVSRVYGASALWVCEIILWLVRAFLRVPAMPFLWVAELYYRLRRQISKERRVRMSDKNKLAAAELVKRSQTEPSTQD